MNCMRSRNYRVICHSLNTALLVKLTIITNLLYFSCVKSP